MRTKFVRELEALGLPRDPPPATPVRDADIADLPDTARRYLRFMRVVGRPRDWSFCAHLDGRFRLAPDRPWVPCECWQYDTSLEVARVFHMRLRFGGVLPTYVRDVYVRGGGHMAGKVLDTFPVVDDESPAVTTGELVTYLNDALLFAPSMLLSPATAWEPVDDGAFDVALSDRGRTVAARVFVDGSGALTDFATIDRFGQDPANPRAGLVRTRWTTPVDGWTLVDGRMRPTRGRAVWHFPSGDFCYAELATGDMAIAYDLPPGCAPLY